MICFCLCASSIRLTGISHHSTHAGPRLICNSQTTALGTLRPPVFVRLENRKPWIWKDFFHFIREAKADRPWWIIAALAQIGSSLVFTLNKSSSTKASDARWRACSSTCGLSRLLFSQERSQMSPRVVAGASHQICLSRCFKGKSSTARYLLCCVSIPHHKDHIAGGHIWPLNKER